MVQDEKLSLPSNWEKILEQMMIRRPIGTRCGRTYICSPCRADSPDGVIRNMMAARVYMFYAHQYFPGAPVAPHAYLPVLLNDDYEDERELALEAGIRFLGGCGKLLVCGNRLSDGMYGEIMAAAIRKIPVQVFNKEVYDRLSERLSYESADPGLQRYPQYEKDHLHYALSMGADDLAPYWEEAKTWYAASKS